MIHRAIAVAAGLVLTTSPLALAQSTVNPGAGNGPQGREGNVYNHQAHQPTEAGVNAAERNAGVAPAPSGAEHEVEGEVNQLLQQTQRLDRQSEEDERGVGSGSSLPPVKGGR